ncbi:acyltransferase family protein [Paenibacillus sp. OV219]|uniref:acyltransferase family protein n=1 Tax=Paenibacillus sp. OV219 TaxID=1884377 RepID=UPI0008D6C0C2|nr:acyltransferase family protein [Paenibacillus sp. OV219]SEP15565.1 Membrane-bound acyltransferase YfiQ, involved in biofilm formation [Paenibacillus sp. OV219]
MGKARIKEVFLLRAVACFSIVFLHSFSQVFGEDYGWIGALRLLLTFGTPAFILISEIVLANAYSSHTPKGFFKKRLRYIGIPFLCFVIIYNIQSMFSSDGVRDVPGMIKQFVFSLLLGETPAYFVLIIFQFYLLHMFFVRHIFNHFRPQWILITAGLVNILYLAFFNFVSAPDTQLANFIWLRFYRMPFFAWVFYFVVAYYLGKNYNTYLKRLLQYQYFVYVSVLLSASASIYLMEQGILPVITSKRFDMIFFTVSSVFMLLILAAKLKAIPSYIVKISQYSFGIYLFHPLVLVVCEHILPFHNSIIGLSIIFALALGGSMGAVATLHRFSWGSYIIGRIGIGIDMKHPNEQKTNERTQSVIPLKINP